MERRGQERDVSRMQHSMNYNSPAPMGHESAVKLPLAPLISTPADRRGVEAAPTRRGSAIFSPTQILDQQNHPPPHLRHQLESPPPLPHAQPAVLAQKEPVPDPDPGGAASNAKAAAAVVQLRVSPPPPPAAAVVQLRVSPPPPPAAAAAAEATNFDSSVKYRECLKNHAASIGGHVVDGCGEFMASGEEGTREGLRCAACDCHRNFHRKEVAGEQPQQSQFYPYNPNSGNNIHQQNPGIPSSPRHQPKHHKHSAPATTMMNFCGNHVAGGGAESSSEELNMFHSGRSGGHAATQPSVSGSKKRFRSKFSQKQKDRMQEFAEKLEWRIQRQDDQELQQFCSEIGVSRQVFKVWMHNNKQARKRKENS